MGREVVGELRLEMIKGHAKSSVNSPEATQTQASPDPPLPYPQPHAPGCSNEWRAELSSEISQYQRIPMGDPTPAFKETQKFYHGITL